MCLLIVDQQDTGVSVQKGEVGTGGKLVALGHGGIPDLQLDIQGQVDAVTAGVQNREHGRVILRDHVHWLEFRHVGKLLGLHLTGIQRIWSGSGFRSCFLVVVELLEDLADAGAKVYSTTEVGDYVAAAI